MAQNTHHPQAPPASQLQRQSYGGCGHESERERDSKGQSKRRGGGGRGGGGDSLHKVKLDVLGRRG